MIYWGYRRIMENEKANYYYLIEVWGVGCRFRVYRHQQAYRVLGFARFKVCRSQGLLGV